MPPILIMSNILFAIVALMIVITGISDLWEWYQTRGIRRELGLDGLEPSHMNINKDLDGPAGQRHSPSGPHRGIAAPLARLRADRLNKAKDFNRPRIG